MEIIFDVIGFILSFVASLGAGLWTRDKLYTKKKYKMPKNCERGKGRYLRYRVMEYMECARKNHAEKGHVPFRYISDMELDWDWLECLLQDAHQSGFSIVLRNESVDTDICTEKEMNYIKDAYKYQSVKRN